MKHPISELKDHLNYDPVTGAITWIKPSSSQARITVGAIAGSPDKDGYQRISFKKRRYQAHHLALAITYGKWPEELVDHINGDPTDNRLSNLREASYSENNRNRKLNVSSSTGFKGVSQSQKTGRYEASIRHDYKRHYLGTFPTPEEAHAAYRGAAKVLHGGFARFN